MFEGLSIALHGIVSRLRRVRSISEQDVALITKQVYDALLMADVPQELVTELLETVRRSAAQLERVEGVKPAEQIVHALRTHIVTLLGGEGVTFSVARGSTVMVVGLQGSGKTTTLAKLAYRIHKQHPTWKLLCGSLDFGRPAAREQLAQLASQVTMSYYGTKAHEPFAAAEELLAERERGGYDLLLVDTAGRLQTDTALMAELRKLHTLLKPAHTVLVLDGMIGQSSLRVAREFAQAVPVTGGIITKTDSGARAGIALAFRSVVAQPLLFLGIGEKYDELEPAVPERIARRIFGDGDLASLAERAEERIAAQERERNEARFRAGQLTLDDFREQITMMRSLGSLVSMSRYLPRELSQGMTDDQLVKGEKDLQRFSAIIQSMTPRERRVPALLNSSRRRRVARGAGVTVAEVNRLLTTFEELQRCATLMKGSPPKFWTK